tara:strand:+ start:238 stop:1035 length:798 start_codon:yes stop_codon:yes gene_type:complete
MFGELVDTSETLKKAVQLLNSLEPQPDVVLVTGDLTDDGTKEQYSLLLEMLSSLNAPLLPLPGNHDERSEFLNAFSSTLPDEIPENHCSYVIDNFPVRLIALDTSLPGQHDALFSEDHELWLSTVLSQEKDKPTLIFTHFPPFETGINFMDLSGLKSADRLEKIIRNNPQVKLVVSGHLHRSIQTSFASTMISVCPSTGNQLKLDLNPKNGSAVDEPPGFQLHLWKNDRFVTHTGIIWDGKELDMSQWVAYVNEKISKNEGIIKD